MDFKSLMSAQISKGKPASTSSNVTTSRYQKRAELEKEREEKYLAEKQRLEYERIEKQEKKRKLEDEEAERNVLREEKKRKLAEESKLRREAELFDEEQKRRQRVGLPPLPNPNIVDKPDIEDEELQAKLKALDAETILPNETHEARLGRYYKLMRPVSIVAEPVIHQGPIPTTLEPLPAEDIIMPDSVPPQSDAEAYAHLHRQIATYLNFLLLNWHVFLSSDADTVGTAHSQQASATTDLTPLMRRLEHHSLPYTTLLSPLVDIIRLTQQRKYRDATDAYLRLSIGKAAWPIGVTMVGIHERSAREKLHEEGKAKDQIAHILSDEDTRRWLQSIKRCISFAQIRWPPYTIDQFMG